LDWNRRCEWSLPSGDIDVQWVFKARPNGVQHAYLDESDRPMKKSVSSPFNYNNGKCIWLLKQLSLKSMSQCCLIYFYQTHWSILRSLFIFLLEIKGIYHKMYDRKAVNLLVWNIGTNMAAHFTLIALGNSKYNEHRELWIYIDVYIDNY